MQLAHLSQLILTLGCVVVLAYFFANAEIHIEGDAGWAANLPTWRFEKHWLLDIFWGGRAMTGYHAWVFTFISIFFHFPLFFMAQWSVQLEARVIASIMLFWITEDFLCRESGSENTLELSQVRLSRRSIRAAKSS